MVIILSKKEELRERIREKIIDQENVEDFNKTFNYFKVKNTFQLWEIISKNIKEKIGEKGYEEINWKEIKFPTLDLRYVKKRNQMFKDCPLYEINLINTQNIICLNQTFFKTPNLKEIKLDLKSCEERNSIFQNSGVKNIEILNTQKIKKIEKGLKDTKSLKKINDLYLDNCDELNWFLENSNIKNINLYNTGKVKGWFGSFKGSNIEEIEVEIESRRNLEYFRQNSKAKKITLKNYDKLTKKISMRKLIRGNKKIEYLKIDISKNVEDMINFIDKGNNIKYLEISGVEEYIKNHIEVLKIMKDEVSKRKIEKLEQILGKKIKIEEDFYEIFLEEETQKYYKSNPIPYIKMLKEPELLSVTCSNNGGEKIEKEKLRIKKIEQIEKKTEKQRKEKQKNIEIII